MALTAAVRQRLEVQGFCGMGDAALSAVEPWLRWSPALCTACMGLGTALRSPAVLWPLAAVAVAGAVWSRHPFDLLYQHAVRRLTRTPPLPPNGRPRRFACGLAAAWLAVTGLAFYAGATAAGLVLGGILTAAAALGAATHVCLSSMLYRAVLGRSRPGATAS